MSDLRILPDSAAIAEAAAQIVTDLAQEAIERQGRFSLALSGGSTPRVLYERLAAEPYASQMQWDKVHIFWGDERCVAPEHLDSNYRMAKEALLDPVQMPAENIHRIKGEIDQQQAAEEYEAVLRDYFGGDDPRFDMLLLGMGDDGHTASLFPHTAALNETERWVVGNFIASKQVWRITLTATAINAASNVLFLVSGGSKAERLKQILKGSNQPDELPSQLIQPRNGNLIWLVDQAAAVAL
jgi:6-phosphogluconolactonase